MGRVGVFLKALPALPLLIQPRGEHPSLMTAFGLVELRVSIMEIRFLAH